MCRKEVRVRDESIAEEQVGGMHGGTEKGRVAIHGPAWKRATAVPGAWGRGGHWGKPGHLGKMGVHGFFLTYLKG